MNVAYNCANDHQFWLI